MFIMFVKIIFSMSNCVLTVEEPRGPHIFPLRMACPGTPRTMRRLRDIDMVEPGD